MLPFPESEYSSDRKNKCLYWHEGVKENKAKIVAWAPDREKLRKSC